MNKNDSPIRNLKYRNLWPEINNLQHYVTPFSVFSFASEKQIAHEQKIPNDKNIMIFE